MLGLGNAIFIQRISGSQLRDDRRHAQGLRSTEINVRLYRLDTCIHRLQHRLIAGLGVAGRDVDWLGYRNGKVVLFLIFIIQNGMVYLLKNGDEENHIMNKISIQN